MTKQQHQHKFSKKDGIHGDGLCALVNREGFESGSKLSPAQN